MFGSKLKTFKSTFKKDLSKKSYYSRKLSNSGNYSSNWEQLRQKRLELDNYKCVHCGFDGKDCQYKLHIHHIIPLSDGGRNIITNLITLCNKCHKELHENKKNGLLFNLKE